MPTVPVTVIVDDPVGVLDEVVTVSVDVPEVDIEVGFKVAVPPLGAPLAVNATVPVKPEAGVTVTV